MNMLRLMTRQSVTPAELSRQTGIGKMAVSRYLAGKNEPAASTRADIARVLATTSEQLLSLDNV